jgi:hypothetical protein
MHLGLKSLLSRLLEPKARPELRSAGVQPILLRRLSNCKTRFTAANTYSGKLYRMTGIKCETYFNFHYWLLKLVFLLQWVVLFIGLVLWKNGKEPTIPIRSVPAEELAILSYVYLYYTDSSN